MLLEEWEDVPLVFLKECREILGSGDLHPQSSLGEDEWKDEEEAKNHFSRSKSCVLPLKKLFRDWQVIPLARRSFVRRLLRRGK